MVKSRAAVGGCFSTYVDHQFGLLCVLVGLCVLDHTVLVLFAVDALVNGLAREAVDVTAHGAPEVVDVVLDDAPAAAVGRLAVKGVLHLLLGQLHRPGQVLLVDLRQHQLHKLKCSFN